MKARISIYLCFFLSAASAGAQTTSDSKPPPDPPIAPLPDIISFRKIFTYPSEKPAPPPPPDQDKQLTALLQGLAVKLKEEDIVKTGTISSHKRHLTDGSVLITYQAGDTTFDIDPVNPDTYVMMAPWMMNGHAPPNQNVLGFAELSWLKASAYQGRSEDQGRKTYRYQMANNEAEIDVETHLPLHAKTPDMEVSYTYLPTPTEKVVLPEKIAAQLRAFGRHPTGATQ